MLYSLAVPLVMVFLFGGGIRSGPFGGFRAAYALPFGMVWAFLGLTRMINNCLGAEGTGINFYYLSPTPLRTVMLGKNAFHLMLFLLEAALITALTLVRFGLPRPSVAAATVAWMLFAIPGNFAAGNLLSILMPYRMNVVRMRQEQGAAGNGLLSMLTQVATLGLGALVLLATSLAGHPWLATPVLLGLAVVSGVVYWQVLNRVDGMMQRRSESLILRLAKTA